MNEKAFIYCLLYGRHCEQDLRILNIGKQDSPCPQGAYGFKKKEGKHTWLLSFLLRRPEWHHCASQVSVCPTMTDPIWACKEYAAWANSVTVSKNTFLFLYLVSITYQEMGDMTPHRFLGDRGWYLHWSKLLSLFQSCSSVRRCCLCIIHLVMLTSFYVRSCYQRFLEVIFCYLLAQ